MENLIIPKFLDAALSPIAKEAGDRLADVLNLVFTPIIMTRKYRDIKVNSFFEDLEKKLRKIPENNIINPPLSIVGPALDYVAKFYYEEEYLRQLFAQLIAASMNKDISHEVHPAFIEIIKQLDLNDVIILNSDYLGKMEIDEESNSTYGKYIRPICDIVYRFKATGEIVRYAAKDFVFTNQYFNNMSVIKFSLSLQNLLRLNIVSIDKSLIEYDSFYKDYSQSNFLDFHNMCKEDSIFKSKDIEVAIIKKELSLTDFGFKFVKTCVC
jgi:hypothetical protein